MNPEANALVEDILRGSFDLHVHAGPDPYQERRVDGLEAARYAREMELAGFVLKSHHYPTAPLSHALCRAYPGLTVLGSICLNDEVGGLNPAAVEASARMGARVVWFPTFSAGHWRRRQGQAGGIDLLRDDGRLREEVHQVLEVVAHYDMVVASGHVSPSETLALFRAARDRGVTRMVATHPLGIASPEEQAEMASLGAYLEYTFLACMPNVGRCTPREMAEAIRHLGVGHCVVTTDFGQWWNPPPAEGMRMAIAALLEAGMSAEEVTALVRRNPRELVSV